MKAAYTCIALIIIVLVCLNINGTKDYKKIKEVVIEQNKLINNMGDIIESQENEIELYASIAAFYMKNLDRLGEIMGEE